MPFNIFRFFIDLTVESYIVAALVFLAVHKYFVPLFQRKGAFLNGLNLIGLGLVTLTLIDEISLLVFLPTNNYEVHWRGTPFWYSFRLLSILGLLLGIIIFFNRSRRKHLLWTFAGMLLLFVPALTHPFESWLTAGYYGQVLPVSFHPFLLSKEVWWLCLLISGIFCSGAWVFAIKGNSRTV